MALDYKLDLQANINPATVLTKISESVGIPMVQDNVLQDTQSRFTVSAYSVTDKWVAEECKKEHGFKPCTYISMRHGKVMGETNESLMMSTVVELLREYEGNAVLEFSESPSIVLKRIDGAITFNSEWQEIAGLDKLSGAGWSYNVEALDEA